MKQFKIFYDFEKEENYLNEMAKKGYIFKKFSIFGGYHFTDESPQNLSYKIDCKIFHSKADFEDYKALFEDAGWIHVFGTRYTNCQCFLPKDTNADKEIFSSRESAAARYKTLYNLCFLNLLLAIISISIVFSSCGFSISSFGFLTPGLWEKTGSSFYKAFFFELPFVIFRVLPPIVLIIIGIFYGYWGSKAKNMFDQQMKGCEVK